MLFDNLVNSVLISENDEDNQKTIARDVWHGRLLKDVQGSWK